MASKIKLFAGVILLTLVSLAKAQAQDTHYLVGALDVDVVVSNPCGGGPNNGSIKFIINNAASSTVSLIILPPGPPGFTSVVVANGSSYTFNPSKNLMPGSYDFIINDGSTTINTFTNATASVLTTLAPITITDNGTNLTNTSCATPNGKIAFDIGGGSKILPAGGSYHYTITSSNGVVGFPLTGVTNGTSTLDVTTLLNASNPPIAGLPGGTYVLTLTDDYSSCGANKSWILTDPSPLAFNTSSATPTVCLGQPGDIQLSNSEGSSVTYEIYMNGVATGITRTGANSLLNFVIPSTLLTSVSTYTFTILASNGFCTPAFMNLSGAISVNPLPVPTITGLALLCEGTTGVAYSTETGKTGYVWSVTGGTITSGIGTSAITVTWTTSGAQTVNVNYLDINGCTAVTPTSKTIAVNPSPVPTITGAASVCIGSTNISYATETGKTGYTWTVVGGAITGGIGTNTIAVSWTTAGAQSVSVNYTDASGCTAGTPTVEPITVNNLPVPTIGGPLNACLNSSSIYTTEIGNSSYAWTVSAGGSITAGTGTNTITVNWSTTGVKTVSVSYVDANGCSPAASTNQSVTVNPLPTPTITGPNAICAGTAGSTYSTEVANVGYTWTVSSGGTITAGTGTSVITVTWNTAGAQTVSVNYADVNGCTAAIPTVENVTVNPLPLPVITGSPIVCIGSTGVSYSTAAGNSGYVWTVSGGVIATGTGTNAITVNWTTVGPQTISVNYTDVNGCTAPTATIENITVNTLPTPTITGPLNACLNSTANVYTTETGNSAYIWTVTGGTITAGTGTNSITVTWTTTGSENVSVNYTNTNGCTAISPTSQAVTVNPIPTPTITGSTSLCVGTVGSVYSTQAGKTGYLWTVSGGIITAGTGTNSITVDWTTAGLQAVSIDYTDVNSCTAPSPTTQTISVNALPIPAIAGATSVCVNSTGNTYSTATGNVAYVWTVSAGGTIVSGAGTNIISVTWNTVGPQSVGVNYTDVNGCTAISPSSMAVTVNSLPVPTITGPLSSCIGSTANTYSTESGNSAYVWNVIGGTITSGAGTNVIVVTWTAAGSQSLNVTYTDPNGCTPTTPATQGVNVIAQPVPTITGTTSVCIGSTGITYVTETGKTGYTWNVTGGSISAGAGTNSITVDWALAGSQSVTVNYTDVSGCAAPLPTTKIVTVNNLPVPTITGNASSCLNTPGNAYSTGAGNSSYVWTVSAGGTITGGSGTNIITVTWTGSGSQLVTVTYTDVNGCVPAAATNMPVTVNNPPSPTITGPTAICAGATGQTYTTEPGETGYIWTIAGGTITAGAATNTITVSWPAAGAGNITVTYTDVNGCTPTTPTPQSVTINNTPNATINPSGPFCSNVISTTLTSLNPGGTWSGVGITDNTLGTFSPSTAGAGTFVITYSITLGTCTDSKTISILVNASPDATITSPTTFCISDPVTLLTANTAGGTWSGVGITNPATGAFKPSVVGATSTTITYTVTVAGCTDTKTTSITVSNAPDATITSAGPFCSNGVVATLAAATPGGVWSGTGITDATLGTFDPNPNHTGNTVVVGNNAVTYTATVGGCSATGNTTIIVNLAPNANITAAGPFCTTDPAVTLTATTPGGTWSGPGVSAVGLFTPASAPIGASTITYTVTSGSCTDTQTTSITVGNPPDGTITPVVPQCSNGLPITLSAVTAGGTWSSASPLVTIPGFPNTTGVFDPTATGAGTFTIKYFVAVGGCSDTQTTSITVNPAPNATITPAGPFCIADSPKTLTAVTPGGTWSGIGVSASGVFTPGSLTPGSYTITYQVTLGSCTDTQSTTIAVVNTVDATITPQGPLCSNDLPVALTAVTPGGTWSSTSPLVTIPGFPNTTGVFDPTATGVGTFAITYSVGTGACSDTKNTSVTVNQAPDASITNPGSFCITDAAKTIATKNPGGTWSGFGVSASGSFDPSIGVGSYPISYTLTLGSCTDTQSITIVVGNPPDASITSSPSTFCNTDPATTFTSANPGGTWSGPGVTAAGVFTPANAGLGTITIKYSIAVGTCSDSQSISFIVKDCAAPPATDCAAFTTSITDTLPSCNIKTDGTIAINVTGGTPPYIITLASPSTGFTQGLLGSGPVFGFVNLSAADYTYTVLDNIGNTCTQPYTLKQQTNVIATSSNLCAGTATVTVTSGGTSPYEYSIDNGLTWISFTSPVMITGLTPSPLPQSVLVRDDAADLCIDNVLVSIGGTGAFLDTLYVKRVVSEPDQATGTMLVGIQESGHEPYQVKLELLTPLFENQVYAQDWTDVVRNPEDLKFEYEFTKLYAGLYTLSIRDTTGCERDYPVTIGVDTNLFIPNVFTPAGQGISGDGINDTFYIRNMPQGTSVNISNRWGAEVYSSKDYKNDWGAVSESNGIYYYKIKAGDKVFTGWVEILRNH